MGISETVTVVEPSEQKVGRLSFSALAKDVATLRSGTMLAAVFNAPLVSLIPRLVSLEDFGYWRLFLLYAGNVGLLHLGMAFLLSPHWRGNGMAVSVTCSEMSVTAAEFYHLARRRLLPSLQFQHEVAKV